MILLDTDIMVDLLRRHPPALAWLETLKREEIGLPGFVVMELLQGCRNMNEQNAMRNGLKDFEVVWPSPLTCDEALETFAEFHLSHGVGLLDALIGQMAVARGNPLHTFNEKHYAPQLDLQTVQPYLR